MRRNNLDILADILQVTLNGARKTHIIYKANLNFNIGKKYLEILIEKELIKQVDGKYYVTTQRGVQFLEQYNEIYTHAKL